MTPQRRRPSPIGCWAIDPDDAAHGHVDCSFCGTMTDKRTAAESGQSNTEKDPEDWVTGDEPMTGAQRSYLKTLSEEAKVDFDDRLTKAEASKRIDELQHITGRGRAADQ
jgi:hypothetical protein